MTGPEPGPTADPSLPSGPGTYALLLDAPASGQNVRIGALGTLSLTGDWLLYVGSALGPGGLRARVGRHLSEKKTLHWHVDHLLEAVEIAEVWLARGAERREEAWADAVRSAPGASTPLRGFGAGDCGCEGHLVRFGARPGLGDFRGWLEEAEVDATGVASLELGRR